MQEAEEESKTDVIELEDGTFESTCPSCHTWKSQPKGDRLSAVRALSGHQKTCSSKERVGATPSEKAEEEVEQPEYAGDLKVVAEILHRYGVTSTLVSRILDSIRLRPQYLDSPFELESLLEAQRIRGERTIRLITMECFEELNPNALRGYGSTGELEPGSRREFYHQDEPEDREELRELRAELKEVREKLQATQLQGLQDQINDLKKTPSFVDQYESFLAASERLGLSQNKGGKSTIDVIDKGIDRLDTKADKLINVLRPDFSPEAKYSSRQRQEKALEIEKKLEKRQEILDAEDALILAARDLFVSDQAPKGRVKQ